MKMVSTRNLIILLNVLISFVMFAGYAGVTNDSSLSDRIIATLAVIILLISIACYCLVNDFWGSDKYEKYKDIKIEKRRGKI